MGRGVGGGGSGFCSAAGHEVVFAALVLCHAAVPVGAVVEGAFSFDEIPGVDGIAGTSEGVPFALGVSFPTVSEVGGARLVARFQPVFDEGIVAALEVGVLDCDIHRDHVGPLLRLVRLHPVAVVGVVIDTPASGYQSVPNVGVPPEFEVPGFEAGAFASEIFSQGARAVIDRSDGCLVFLVIPDGEDVVVGFWVGLNAGVAPCFATPAESFVIGEAGFAIFGDTDLVDENVTIETGIIVNQVGGRGGIFSRE